MKMAYTKNENVAKVRAYAVRMVRSGKSTREVARHFGYGQSTIVKWCARAPKSFVYRIETRSSAPKNSPRALPKEIVGKIIHARIESKRCSEVVYEMLKMEGVKVSLSSIKRTLSRYNLLKKRSKWKKLRVYPPRPEAKSPGMLVELDTIHFMTKERKRVYVYTALDVYSRYGFALLFPRVSAARSVSFLRRVIKYFPFKVKNVQTDNGPEFGVHFTDVVVRMGLAHHHTHVRSPNENGHLERFNRTIQEEIGKHGWCIYVAKDVRDFLRYYNTKRLHMGINFKTPRQMLELTDK